MLPASEYLASVVKPILNHPDNLTVSQSLDDMGVLLTVTVHKNDMGLLLGRKGETARAIRHMVRIVGMTSKQRVSIHINEPENSDYQTKNIEND